MVSTTGQELSIRSNFYNMLMRLKLAYERRESARISFRHRSNQSL
jgi:hypothetical protein